MPVSKSNLYFSRGDTFTFPCLAQNYSQTPIDITSSVITCTAKRTPSGNSLFTGSPTITDAEAGTFTITFLAASTASLPDYPQVLPYDVRVTNGAATYSVQSGQIYLSPETLP